MKLNGGFNFSAFMVATLSVFALAACNMEDMPSSGSQSDGISGPATLLNGVYVVSSDCSSYPTPVSAQACRRTEFRIEQGVGYGTLYAEDSINGGLMVNRDYQRVEFSNIVNGRFNVSITMVDGILNPGAPQTFTSEGRVWTAGGSVAGIRWNEQVMQTTLGRTWHRQSGTGRTVGDEHLDILTDQARRQAEERQRQQQEATAVLTGLAAGLSGQELATPSQAPGGSAGAPPIIRADQCVDVTSNAQGSIQPHFSIRNTCSSAIIVLYCDASTARCPASPIAEYRQGQNGATYSTARLDPGETHNVQTLRRLRWQAIEHYIFADSALGYCRVRRNGQC